MMTTKNRGEQMNASKFTGLVGYSVNLAFLLLGIALIALPLVFQVDMMDGGAASLFIGIFITACSSVLLPFFAKRAAIMKRIHRGDGVLAWWHYEGKAWEKRRDKEIGELGAMKLGGFALAILFALIGLIVFLMDVRELGLFLLMMLGIGAFFILFSQIAARVAESRLKSTEDEAVIHTDGLFFRGSLTSWGRMMNRLEAVGWDPANPDALVFCFRQLQRFSIRPVFERIPIPLNESQTATEIVASFNLPLTPFWMELCQASGKEA